MTPFTDKQLNKLKKLCDYYGPMEQGIALIPHEVVSLIDRLKAAERCAEK